jgi:hypothetical protein
MSLTRWIRDYVFMTSYKAAATKYPRWAHPWSYGLLFLALFITGIWHGTTSGFLVFGVLNGIGAAANRAYGDVLKAALGRSGVERYLGSRSIRCLAIVATFHYVCFCHLAFSSDITMSGWVVLTDATRQVLEIVQAMGRLHWWTVSLAALFVAALLLAGSWKSDAPGGITARLTVWLVHRTPAVVCVQIVIMTFLFFLDWTVEQEPPRVIYMRF